MLLFSDQTSKIHSETRSNKGIKACDYWESCAERIQIHIYIPEYKSGFVSRKLFIQVVKMIIFEWLARCLFTIFSIHSTTDAKNGQKWTPRNCEVILLFK
jgi:hypothetical protein